jgi:hypothetical protein
MEWHKVHIENNEVIRETVEVLILDFQKVFRNAGAPAGAKVYVSKSDSGDRTYYFSPEASSIGAKILRDFNASVCDHEPDVKHMKEITL